MGESQKPAWIPSQEIPGKARSIVFTLHYLHPKNAPI